MGNQPQLDPTSHAVQPETDQKEKESDLYNLSPQKKKIYQQWWFWVVVVVLFFLVISSFFLNFNSDNIIINNIKHLVNVDNGQKVDDWQYDSSKSGGSTSGSISQGIKNLAGPIDFGVSYADNVGMGSPAGNGNIGFSTGGAKDINNFRQNIANDYLPLPTDITYEGLFYDYYFDTGQSTKCEKLFCPSYSYAVSKDPFSGQDEYYLSVGLNSGIKESDFERKKLNLVVVLDISGSMSSPFDRYYYDQFGRQIEVEDYTEKDSSKSKMEVAAQSVVALLDHLEKDDSFGMVLFDDTAYLAKPLNLVGDTDMSQIKNHILELAPAGGTQMSAGMKMGTELFAEFEDVDSSLYENRIIFLTDAMPNLGDTSQEGLLGQTSLNAENKTYTTFIGIGVDFNTELTEAITKVRGANYYSVHSPKEFKTRMDDEFEYMVTPLVFNLVLSLDATGYEIEKVYGSPEANEATGEIMKVNTLFPSKTKGGETRGGLVLLKLKKTSSSATLILKTSYEDRQGNQDGEQSDIVIDKDVEFYGNTGIRKGILLTRYTNLISGWIKDERRTHVEPKVFTPCITMESGIIIPPVYMLGEWERQSIPLQVSDHYQELFKKFKDYFVSEKDILADEELSQEIIVLDKIGSNTFVNPNDQDIGNGAKSISEIKQLQTALELYYVDHNSHPENLSYGVTGKDRMACLSSIGWDDASCSSSTIYMRSVFGGSNMNTAPYVFVSGGKNTYYLFFTLGLDTGGLKAGLNIASPNGIKHVTEYIDSDSDELPDEVELILGTNTQQKDTDGDSYFDGQEIQAGYNPLGEGKLPQQ